MTVWGNYKQPAPDPVKIKSNTNTINHVSRRHWCISIRPVDIEAKVLPILPTATPLPYMACGLTGYTIAWEETNHWNKFSESCLISTMLSISFHNTAIYSSKKYFSGFDSMQAGQQDSSRNRKSFWVLTADEADTLTSVPEVRHTQFSRKALGPKVSASAIHRRMW